MEERMIFDKVKEITDSCMKSNNENMTDSQNSRRSFIKKSGGTIAVSTIGISQVTKVMGDDGFCPFRQTHSNDTILAGTEREVKVYINESGSSGPTAVVAGGIQGNEPVGWHTANAIRNWSIDSGKLVVLPKLNPVAIQRGTYVNDNGDLNDQFPPGGEPRTKLARAIWNYIEKADPDVFFNLHSSHGIYHSDVGPSGVGQAIYPTYIDGARADARNTIQYMNNRFNSLPSFYDFRLGNTLYGIRPLLTHKVAADLQIPGFLVESTRYGTDLEKRVKWEKAIVAHILQRNGMNIKA